MIYATDSLRNFVNVFGRAILDELRPKGKRVWEQFLSMAKSLRPSISFDINGMPSLGISLGEMTPLETTLDD